MWSLSILGLGLLAALLIQVRFGLQPLRRMRQAIVAVRTGRAQRLEGEFPVEIAPLSDELNTLIEHNAAVLERARTQVSNLAHALKTPLSVLANEAAAAGPLADTVKRQIAAMRRHVDHYLARARAAAATRVIGVRTDVVVVVEDLRRTLERIYVDRGIRVDAEVAAGLAFRGERQDLEEMLGNLMDNACKWARAGVAVAARQDSDRIVVTVDDDGPGLPDDRRAAVFDRGTRLDESVPGSGLGLAIVRDIAELYSGTILLGESPKGGLRATLTLPAVTG
jgi:signal transduction histidine kinase